MKILVVSQYFWPENFRINDLVSELLSRGHEVTVLTGVPNYPDGEIFPEYKNNSNQYAAYKGAEIVRVPLIPRKSGAIWLLLNYISYFVAACTWGVFKLRGRKFDVIFTCQLSPVTVGLPAALLRRLKGIPMIFWVLDLWPESLQAVGVVKSNFLLNLVGKLTGFIYRHCDLILVQSRAFIPQILKYAPSVKCIEYFPSWAEDVFSSNEEVLATEVTQQQGLFNVMFAGNIGDAQDFPAILAAAKKLKQYTHIRWLILGDGRAAKWVKDEIIKNDLTDSVFMLGRYPLERMPSFFKHAQVLLVTLRDEPIFSMTIPGKMQSYLAAGIPVISMLNGEGADVIRSSKAGISCAAGDSDGLADAVLSMSKLDGDVLSAMGLLGKQYGEDEFSRMKLMNKLENWLKVLHLSGATGLRGADEAHV